MIRKALALCALPVIALMVAGCPGDSSGSASPHHSGRGPVRPAPAATARSGGGAALFSLPMADGQPVTVQTPAALFFFTSWCGYCKQAMPELKTLAQRARGMGWRVYGINVQEGPAQVNGFVQQYQPNFPIVLDQYGEVMRQYGIRGYPTFVLIDENANIIYNGHEIPRRF